MTMIMIMILLRGIDGGTILILRIKEQEIRQTHQEHYNDDDDYDDDNPRKTWMDQLILEDQRTRNTPKHS